MRPTPIFVKYAFQSPDENKCPPSTKNDPLAPITVTIPANGTAQNVLEASVNVNSAYRFTATYLGSTPGYFVDAINGTALSGSCFCGFPQKSTKSFPGAKSCISYIATTTLSKPQAVGWTLKSIYVPLTHFLLKMVHSKINRGIARIMQRKFSEREQSIQ